MFILYEATNRLNGQCYIGYTSRTLEVRKRWHKGGAANPTRGRSFFAQAIRKYGMEAFDFCEIGRAETKEQVAAAEIQLIAERKPHYNATKGGDGNLGRIWTAESREKIAASKRGNSYRLGSTHTEDVRHRLREAGLRDKEKWAIRARSGPISSRRQVICLYDARHHESATAAAYYYGVAKSAVIELCLGQRGRKSIRGLSFQYLEAT